jgi:ectoine hydroxylase-related dioxygenase (phytanoyl-CoA dioxygenase family)
MITAEQKTFYDANGYVVAPGLFSPDEVAGYRDHYMDLRAKGTYPGDMIADTKLGGDDPLVKFPRMIHMHRWDDTTLRWLLDARLNDCLTVLLGDEPLAVQSMLYFKPAGARGQALHQDNFYLNARPGTCMAAWLALDACDEENGCMRVVPGSHAWPVLCPAHADTSASFTNVTVPLPPNAEAVPILMNAGDVLFFNGTLVHGSFPNTSAGRFRRSLIGHYIEQKAEQVTGFDQPVLKMDGTAFRIGESAGGGPCGVWVDKNGAPVIEIAARELAGTPAHE